MDPGPGAWTCRALPDCHALGSGAALGASVLRLGCELWADRCFQAAEWRRGQAFLALRGLWVAEGLTEGDTLLGPRQQDMLGSFCLPEKCPVSQSVRQHRQVSGGPPTASSVGGEELGHSGHVALGKSLSLPGPSLPCLQTGIWTRWVRGCVPAFSVYDLGSPRHQTG